MLKDVMRGWLDMIDQQVNVESKLISGIGCKSF